MASNGPPYPGRLAIYHGRRQMWRLVPFRAQCDLFVCKSAAQPMGLNPSFFLLFEDIVE